MSEQVEPDKISRAVRGYFLAIRAMDADAFANAFAEDGTTCDPMGAPPITGRPAIREFLQSICKNFKSVALTEDSVFVAGNGGLCASADDGATWSLLPLLSDASTSSITPDPAQQGTICIDEVDLGLHPDALKTLAGLLKEVSKRRQIIVTTHNVSFLNYFTETPSAIFAFDHAESEGGFHATSVRRVGKGDIPDEMLAGEAWQRGLIGGTRW